MEGRPCQEANLTQGPSEEVAAATSSEGPCVQLFQRDCNVLVPSSCTDSTCSNLRECCRNLWAQPKKPNLDCKAKGKPYQLVCFDKSKLFIPNVAVIAPITDPKTKAIACPRHDKVLSACCDIGRLDGQTMGGSGWTTESSIAGACPGFKFHF
ncbi:hypothetical protein PGT21_028758 [Puccinia graminis f. sp. tritici]|uniref:Uncharacterized protein n=1 Tax=Puccinia graminis f. sp. tritici TaxID=56615 RepID=A0A5B0M6H4_PUCGR|nr:hypothetical protein PGT21_028758 [Puccinia graminis f. sp. tritici]KAA1135251.1 hypothetical protein PGTUg99_022075 [Puccinia graminis f. sp. tritici]